MLKVEDSRLVSIATGNGVGMERLDNDNVSAINAILVRDSLRNRDAKGHIHYSSSICANEALHDGSAGYHYHPIRLARLNADSDVMITPLSPT